MHWGPCLRALLVLSVVGIPTAASANANFLGLWQDRGGNAHHDGRGRVRPTDLQYPLLDWTASNEAVQEAGSASLGDLDGDGVHEELGLDGGTVVATDRDLSVVWTSENIDANRVFGVFWLGGSRAVIVGAGDGIAVLDPATGGTAWTAEGVAGFDVVELGGAEGLELIVRTSAPSLAAYAFDGSLTASEGWSVSDIPDGDFDLAVGDVNDDGAPEIVGTDAEGGRIFVLTADTGDTVREREGRTVMGTRGCGPAHIVQTDDDAQAEVILTGARAGDGDGSVFVAVYDHVDDAMQWRYEYGHGDAQLALDMLPDAVADFDGDGDWEIVVSIFNNNEEVEPDSMPEAISDLDGISNPNAWTTVIYDAATGEVVDHRTDTRAVAIVRVSGESRPVLVLRDAMRSLDNDHPDLALTGYTLGADGMEDIWRLQGARVVSAVSGPSAGCAGQAEELAADLDGDGGQEIFIERHLDADGEPDLVQRVSLIYDTPVVDAALPLTAAHQIVGVHAGTGVLDGTGHVALQLGDGHLTVLDGMLGSQKHFRLGSLAADPRVMRLPENDDAELGDQQVVVRNRKGVFEVRDVAFAPAVRPAWQLAAEGPQPNLAPLNNDSYSMFLYTGIEDGTPFLREVDHAGETVWTRSFADASAPPHAYALGEFTGNAHDDLMFIVGDDPVLELIDGHSGELRRSRPLSDIGAVGDNARILAVPGELGEFDDIVLVGDEGAYYIDTDDMSTRTALDMGANTRTMVSLDIDGNDVHEVFDNAGGAARSMIDPATNTVLWSVSNGDSDDHSYFGIIPNYPGIADADADDHYDVAIPGRFGDLTVHKGDTGEILWRVCLSGGNVTAVASDVAPTRDLCDGGLLTDVSSGNMSGDEEGGEQFIVGSDDGWLYAVNVRDGSPMWSMPFYAPVGSAMLVSTDDFADAELMVNVANGSSFGFRDGLPPTAPRDVEVSGNELTDPETDIDEAFGLTALGVAWDPVEGAEGYEVALIGDDGLLRTFEDVGEATEVLVDELVLHPGHTYRGAVRAYSQDRGLGHVAWTDGVTIPDNDAPVVADVSATPELFSPALGGSTDISAVATDQAGLRGVLVSASLGEDTVWSTTVAGLRENMVTVETSWDGLVDGAPAADGEYTIRVTALDFGGNEASETATVTLDSTPPPVPTIEAPEDGAALVTSPVSISGSAPDAAVVEVSVNGEVLCTVELDAAAFSCDTAALEDGDYAITAVSSDALGNRSEASAPVTFIIDTTPPEAPAITSPEDGVTIEETLPTFAGTSEAGTSVVVSIADGDEVCTATTDDTGAFSCVGTVDFDPGQYTVNAVATDDNGLVSDVSADVTFTVAKPPANNGANNGGNNGANNGMNQDGVATTSDDGCGCETPSRKTRSPLTWLLRR